MSNPFFRNNGPILLLNVLKNLNITDFEDKENVRINDIKDLYSSNNSDITFFHSKKYVEIAKNTKASFLNFISRDSKISEILNGE